MKLANYEKDGFVRAGIVKGEEIYEIPQDSESAAISSVDQILDESLLEAVRRNEDKITSGRGTQISAAKLKSPVIYPEKIILVAVNYGAHGKEEHMQPPPYPYFFAKYRNALLGPGEAILAPRASTKVDWEGELAVIIGKEGKDIRREDAYEHIAGYTISNDVSFRDLQKDRTGSLGMNWIKGKSLDASFPLGPWLVTRDEIPDPHVLDISLSVNGVEKQSSNTGDMLKKVDEMVAYASLGMTLRPGDIISTGTPSGVGDATGGPYLKEGDIVEVKIEKIGTLRNPVRAES